MTTNYERIKNMTVEEMVEFFVDNIVCENCPAYDYCDTEDVTYEDCPKFFMKWLQSESEIRNFES